MAKVVTLTLSALCFFLLFTQCSSQTGCQPGFKLGPDSRSCYNAFLNARNWTDAQSHCRGWQSDLASVTSQEELHFLWDHVVNETFYYYWIGLYKNPALAGITETRDGWQWVDGTPYDTSWHIWGRARPAIRDTFALMYISYTGTKDPYWTGEASGIGKHVFICEQNLFGPPTLGPSTTTSTTRSTSTTTISSTLSTSASTTTLTTESTSSTQSSTPSSTSSTPTSTSSTTSSTTSTTSSPSTSSSSATTMSTLPSPTSTVHTSTTMTLQSTSLTPSSSLSSTETPPNPPGSRDDKIYTTTTNPTEKTNEWTNPDSLLSSISTSKTTTSSSVETATRKTTQPEALALTSEVKLAIGLGVGLGILIFVLLAVIIGCLRGKKSRPERLYDDVDPYTPGSNTTLSSTVDWTAGVDKDTASTYETLAL